MLCCSHIGWLNQWLGQCPGASPTFSGACETDSGGKSPCKTGLHSDSSVLDVTFINMDCSLVLYGSGHGVCAFCVHSLLGRKGGSGLRSSREQSSGPSFVICLLKLWTHPLLSWASDVSATKWGHLVRGFLRGFTAALKCYLWLWLARGKQGL